MERQPGEPEQAGGLGRDEELGESYDGPVGNFIQGGTFNGSVIQVGTLHVLHVQPDGPGELPEEPQPRG